MYKQRFTLIIFILFLNIDLGAQGIQMGRNSNRIDIDFISSPDFETRLKKQDIVEGKINLILERKNDSLYSIYLLNKTSDSIDISIQDSQLFLIQEAKNENGEWKPAEYWGYSSCGNSYHTEKISPNGALKTQSLAYSGNVQTKIRFKLLHDNQVYYSNSIEGFVSRSQFSLPKNIANNYYMYEIIERVGNPKLLNKILFLEPNGMKELEEKQKAYWKKMAELRKKN